MRETMTWKHLRQTWQSTGKPGQKDDFTLQEEEKATICGRNETKPT